MIIMDVFVMWWMGNPKAMKEWRKVKECAWYLKHEQKRQGINPRICAASQTLSLSSLFPNSNAWDKNWIFFRSKTFNIFYFIEI